jgi:carbonic anhydrase/acetyltransferase-like protein (isoleucine patch superfamily)
MAMIIELDGISPTIGEDVFLVPTAVLVGDVRVADRANIWFGAVLRGDKSYIEIGAEASIGVPALEKKHLSGAALRWTRTAADEYQQFSKRYMAAARVRVDDNARIA